MTFSEFKKEYEKASNKEAFMKKRIVRKYVPILEKIGMFKGLVKSSIIEKPFLHFDNIILEVNRFMSIIALYTDIEPDDVSHEDGRAIILFDMYDWFKENEPKWELEIFAGVVGTEIVEIDNIWSATVINIEEEYISNQATINRFMDSINTETVDIIKPEPDAGLDPVRHREIIS